MTFLNDSLDDLLGGPMGEVRVEPIRAPVDYKPRDFTERCGKCGGTGSWRGRGQCFACKGKGRFTFKTSPETRAANRQKVAARKVAKAQAGFEEFKAAQPVIAEWIEQSTDFSFAVNMREAIEKFGSLTEGQMAACQRCVDKRNAARQERAERLASAPAADEAGVDRLKAAFDTAIAKAAEKGRGFRNPRLTIGGMVISPAKAGSRNEGALYVKTGGTYLGKIQAGRFYAARECAPEQQTKVLAFVADPKAAAIAYGQETGVCCICNTTLTNKISIEAGIGPICAAKWGW